MVNTRQNQSTPPSIRTMPTRDVDLHNSSTMNHRLKDRSDKSGMDNDSDCEPLVRNRPSRWRRQLRSRYSSNFRTLERVSRHPERACRMRLVSQRMDSYDDLMDDSFNDDDDEAIFTPLSRKTRYGKMARGISESPTRHAGPSSSLRSQGKMENGVKEEDGEEEDIGEGEGAADDSGVRRSKRQRKLLYDNFNQSWILGTQTVLRGYPDIYGSREAENADATSNSNDECAPDELPTAEVPDAKPVEGNDDDMYTKVKRTRRNRIRYSPSGGDLTTKRVSSRRTRVPVAGDTTESESAASSDEAPNTRRGQRRVYHLRQNKPMVDRFQISNHEAPRRSSRLILCSVRRRPFQRKRRDSTSSDEERFQRKKAISMAKARSRCMPLNYKQSDLPAHQKTPVHSSKPVSGASGPKGPADVDPMTIDTSVTFEKVGGLEAHLRCLKEMVVFPMMYREIFEKFHVQPPKGVLFHGPPGTGKTLIARALANECSQGDRKVAFFMRKGADCLSKWVGESERQLRLLFEQAYQMRPSIIFFDEIDGLAPVRSSKQDQIHASIVSTLLALLDGLDDRGEIIVIGATNRIDTIDPALRRPGRFDRELYFPLPGKKERVEILSIHTKPWANPPSNEIIARLAEKSVGYCGSDLRLLCSEAVVGAMRRRYPQIYKSSKKLLLKPELVDVHDEDFDVAQTKIVPASCRVNACPRARLSSVVAPLLQAQFTSSVENVARIFPHALLASTAGTVRRSVYKPHFLLCGADGQYGQTSQVAPALLDLMEHIPVHVLGLDTLLDTSNRSPEEAVIQIIREASRNPPSILYIPAVDTWWDLVPATAHRILIDRLFHIAVNSPVLLLGTAHCLYNDLNEQIKSLFRYDYQELRLPTRAERSQFFLPVLTEDPLKEPPPPPIPEEEWEELPEAPPPEPPPPSTKDLEELHNSEEQRLRELRLFLRDICAKLVRNRQFYMFSKPVDVKEVPDYLSIIQKPMDLETMMTNIDLHVYNSAQEFLSDIDLIVANALEYNPEKDPEDKLIRHRACSLRDTAYTLIKAEMDTDFEEECRKISSKRRITKEKENKTEATASEEPGPSETVRSFVGQSEADKTAFSAEEAKRRRLSAQGVKPSSSLINAERIRRRKSTWARGLLRKKTKSKIRGDDDSATLASGESTPYEIATDPPGKRCTISPVEMIKESKPSRATLTAGSNSGVPLSNGMPECTKQTTEAPSSTEEGTPKKRAKKRNTRRLEISTKPGVMVNEEQLKELHSKLVTESEGWTISRLLDCHALLRREIEAHMDCYDREQLIENFEAVILKFRGHQ